MKFEANILEDYKGKPSIVLDDDGTIIKFHCNTEDTGKLKELWRNQTVFYIVSEDDLKGN